MYGYVRPDADELKVRDYKYYRAVYCGLCHTMAKEISPLCSLTIRYDFVLLVLVRMLLSGESGRIFPARCMIHPFRKHMTLECNEALRYSARCAAILGDAAILDNIEDEKGIRRLCYRFIHLFTKKWSQKAKSSGLPDELTGAIFEGLQKQHKVENSMEKIPDAAAVPFGDILSAVFSAGFSGENKRIASEIGKHTGRFIYLADAFDDAAEDEKKGNYNPIVLLAHDDGVTVSSWLKDDNNRNRLFSAMQLEGISAMRAMELSDSVDAADTEQNSAYSCVSNVLTAGMRGEKIASIRSGKKSSNKDTVRSEKIAMRKTIHDGSV